MILLFVLDSGLTQIQILQTFGYVLLFYHLSEGLLQAYFNPTLFGFGSFLFQRNYLICLVLALIEFYVEWNVFQLPYKGHPLIVFSGLFLVILGELIRKVGVITAQHNFTHVIQEKRRAKHILVNWGIYAYIRHPGYLGWFLWTIGNQIMLVNPICTILFTVVAWLFFSSRIPFEEQSLIIHFGQKYIDYRKSTPTLIPFIK